MGLRLQLGIFIKHPGNLLQIRLLMYLFDAIENKQDKHYTYPEYIVIAYIHGKSQTKHQKAPICISITKNILPNKVELINTQYKLSEMSFIIDINRHSIIQLKLNKLQANLEHSVSSTDRPKSDLKSRKWIQPFTHYL